MKRGKESKLMGAVPGRGIPPGRTMILASPSKKNGLALDKGYDPVYISKYS
jgi:hypothetical protein